MQANSLKGVRELGTKELVGYGTLDSNHSDSTCLNRPPYETLRVLDVPCNILFFVSICFIYKGQRIGVDKNDMFNALWHSLFAFESLGREFFLAL